MLALILLTAIAAVLFVDMVRSHHMLRRAIGGGRTVTAPARFPPVTVIRPIKGKT